MFIYIDALFSRRDRPEERRDPQAPAGGLMTTDYNGSVRDAYPFLLRPEVIAVARSDGDVFLKDSSDTASLLTELNKYLTTEPLGGGNDVYVGWYLDQVIIPALCVNAMACDVNLPPRLFRKLDDKWSKTNSHSVERAFLQGWYPSEKDNVPNFNLSLGTALDLSNMQPLFEIEQAIGADLPQTHKTMLSRLSAISKLFTRYQDILAGEQK